MKLQYSTNVQVYCSVYEINSIHVDGKSAVALTIDRFMYNIQCIFILYFTPSVASFIRMYKLVLRSESMLLFCWIHAYTCVCMLSSSKAYIYIVSGQMLQSAGLIEKDVSGV